MLHMHAAARINWLLNRETSDLKTNNPNYNIPVVRSIQRQ